ncbi:hypothetical protein QJQ45_012548 [Haematococcus lacustris]|nr:hypothetical protein QJQ45_012548 [Haematococcus lacustris]
MSPMLQVMYSPLEETRVRQFELKYHLEDNSLEILEPLQANSGLPHGKYLQRNKWAAKEAEEERRRQLSAPTKPQLADKDNDEQPVAAQRGSGAMFQTFKDNKAQEHLANKVLRFFCCWDDTKRIFGQKLHFALHYFLSDNTVEVAEMHRRNTGRDPFPLLLSRCKLPKAPNIPGSRPLSPRTNNIQYYHWQDLCVGAIVKVYGRDLQIYDLDGFTRDWLRKNSTLSERDLQPIVIDQAPQRPPLYVPPNTLGIGSEEDSMQNVLHLVPKPHRSWDYNDYLEKWNKVLRFTARMVNVPGHDLVGPHDAERRFVISHHLLDQTTSIFEPRQPNTGLRGGMFLERTKVKHHGQDLLLAASDFQIGAHLVIYARGFELLSADQCTLAYLEHHPWQFPHADFDQVMRKAQSAASQTQHFTEQLRQAIIKHDREGLGYITAHQLQAVLSSCGIRLTRHECLTLVRELGADRQGVVAAQLVEALQPRAELDVPEPDPLDRQAQLDAPQPLPRQAWSQTGGPEAPARLAEIPELRRGQRPAPPSSSGAGATLASSSQVPPSSAASASSQGGLYYPAQAKQAQQGAAQPVAGGKGGPPASWAEARATDNQSSSNTRQAWSSNMSNPSADLYYAQPPQLPGQRPHQPQQAPDIRRAPVHNQHPYSQQGQQGGDGEMQRSTAGSTAGSSWEGAWSSRVDAVSHQAMDDAYPPAGHGATHTQAVGPPAQHYLVDHQANVRYPADHREDKENIDGKEVAGLGVGQQPGKDPRFAPPPGGIGYGLGAAPAARAFNQSVRDGLGKQQQPVSLWQTTNMAAGGVGHHRSFKA